VAKQEQVTKSKSVQRREAVQEEAAKVDDKQALKDELDSLLDEIDAVLEENAEEFVKAYIQKGGE
jgi:prokaryotic ubiquitin-like protein Pup